MAMNPLEAMQSDDVSVSDAVNGQRSAPQPTEVAGADTVEEKRKLWQIFTDDDGEVQRKSFTVSTNQETPANHVTNGTVPTNNDHADDDTQETDALLSPVYSTGFSHSQAQVPASLSVLPTDSVPPPKPARRVEIVARQNGGTTDTVVFQNDTTYVPLNVIEADSDEELFGGRNQT